MGTLALFLISLTTIITGSREYSPDSLVVATAAPLAGTSDVVSDGAMPNGTDVLLHDVDVMGNKQSWVEEEEPVVTRYPFLPLRSLDPLSRDGKDLPGTAVNILSEFGEPHLMALLR